MRLKGSFVAFVFWFVVLGLHVSLGFGAASEKPYETKCQGIPDCKKIVDTCYNPNCPKQDVGDDYQLPDLSDGICFFCGWIFMCKDCFYEMRGIICQKCNWVINQCAICEVKFSLNEEKVTCTGIGNDHECFACSRPDTPVY